jgi:hypothetical protein
MGSSLRRTSSGLFISRCLFLRARVGRAVAPLLHKAEPLRTECSIGAGEQHAGKESVDHVQGLDFLALGGVFRSMSR